MKAGRKAKCGNDGWVYGKIEVAVDVEVRAYAQSQVTHKWEWRFDADVDVQVRAYAQSQGLSLDRHTEMELGMRGLTRRDISGAILSALRGRNESR